MTPTPKPRDESERISDEEIEDYVDALNLVFNEKTLITVPMLRAIYFVFAVELLGSRIKAAEALGIDATTGWRWLREMRMDKWIRKQKQRKV